PDTIRRGLGMKGPELKLLEDFRDEDRVPRFAVRRWNAQDGQFQLRNVSISDDELREQLTIPVRIADEPSYWLFRGRVVKEEGPRSQPDKVVDILEDVSGSENELRRASQSNGSATRWA